MIELTERQAHEGRSAADMLDGLRAGQILRADRDHSKARPDAMTARGAGERLANVTQPGAAACNPFLYRYRNLLERFLTEFKRKLRFATAEIDAAVEMPPERPSRCHPH